MSVLLGALAALAVMLAGGAWYVDAPQVPKLAWPGLPGLRLPTLPGARGQAARIEAALPEFLEELARGLRSGSSMRTAVRDAGQLSEPPLSHDLMRVQARLENGVTLEVALDEWTQRRSNVRAVHLVAAAASMASTAGGSVAQAIDGVADTIRSDLDLRAEVRALASQAEASAVLVAVLPVAFALIAGLTDPRTLTFLLGTRIGLISLAIGVGLDLVGLLWMRKITSGIVA
ncbi:MAG: type II secretion system F family protein [Acidimicrobiales bacterium]